MNNLLVTLVVALIFSLNSAIADETKNATEGTRTVIGLSLPLTGYPVFAAGIRGAQEAAKPLGVELVVVGANWDPGTQARDIDNLVMRHVDGIVVWPMPWGSLVPNIEAAVSAGIPVAIANTGANTDKGLVFVTDDADVLLWSGEQPQQIVLHAVRVLIFVHVNVSEE